MEEIYYYRWWTYRKHIKKTQSGYIISEFLPDVPWSGKYNSINVANGHHLAEGRWLRCCTEYLDEYIQFWFSGIDNAFKYSTWLISAIWDYCCVCGDFSIGIKNLDYFFVDNIEYHGHSISVLWDRTGMHYNAEKGLHIYCDGNEKVFSNLITKITIKI